MKKTLTIIALAALISSCKKETNNLVQGKIERDQISVVSKLPGRILEIYVQEGNQVKKGDTLALIDIPEVEAKKEQAAGAVKSAKAQYEMAAKGATANQLKQLEAKKKALNEQFQFAKKSLQRIETMVKDSLVPQQTYDEVFAKYQGAQSQLIAVEAEIADVKNGVRVEQQVMALGQQDRAMGALLETEIAENERYILAPQDMTIETITLQKGELALPGYTLFNGYLLDSVYFRFTLPEGQLSKVKKNQEVSIEIPYNNTKITGIITQVKELGAYAKIATAYPDYDIEQSLFEIKIKPKNVQEAQDLFTKATVTTAFEL